MVMEALKPALVEIDVDVSKCTTPMACRRCLELCPQVVFQCVTLKQVKYQETDINEPGASFVAPLHRWKCTGCGICVQMCPQGALAIRFRGSAAARAAAGGGRA